MATPNITIKLMIDKKSNKLIFAESSKDFVDFLFFLLSLPIGTAMKLIASESTVGSFGNLYTSFSNLTIENGNVSLNPMEIIPFVIGTTAITSGNFRTCLNSKCNLAIINNSTVDHCSRCSKRVYREIKVVGGSNTAAPSNSKQGFGQESVSYIISDDLSVTQMSARSIISMLDNSNVSRLDMLEEREVKVGNEEGLQLLKASFQSKTVFTDVFLDRKMEKVST